MTHTFRIPGNKAVQVEYTNHEGKRRLRTIVPLEHWFGTSEPYHPEPGWYMTAYDLDREAIRFYAMSGVHQWIDRPLPPGTKLPTIRHEDGKWTVSEESKQP